MILAIDNGNTNTAFGLFRNNKLVRTFKTANLHHSSAESYRDYFSSRRKDIHGAVISSAVPARGKVLAEMTEIYLNIKPVIVSYKLELGIGLKYKNPARLGPDRICSAAGAYSLFKGPAIIVDFGTAITFNVVSEEGDFLGGLISPGVSASASALHRRTGALPLTKPAFPKHIIGNDTVSGIKAGIMFGTLGAVEGIIVRLKKTLGGKCRVIGTGGDVDAFAGKTGLIDTVEPHLVLKGAYIIYRLNRSNH